MESGKWKGKKRVPELRFPEFEGEWEEKKLGEVFNSISSGKSKLGKGIGNYNLYGSTGIIGKINKCDYEGKKILIARVGENTGYVNLANGEYGVTDNTLILDEYDEKSEVVNYYYYYLCNYDFRRIKIGSGQPLITGRDLKNIKVYRSKIEEQQKIGDFFYKIDKKLELQQQRIEALKEYKKGMMQKIFSQEIRFKDDNGKDYPEWEEKRFSSFLSVPKKVKVENPKIDNIITVRLHRRGIYSGVQRENLSLGSTNYFYREEGQFIYGKQNIFNGAFGILPKEFDGHYSSADIPALDINEKHIRAEFFDSYLSQISVYKRLENKAIGTGSKRLHESVLLKEEMLVPSLPEQTKIANFLSSLDKKIELEEEKLENFKQFKKGLMQKMFI